MSGGIPSEGILGEGTLLFPMLTGLFGVPPLLERHEKKRARHQDDDGCDPVGPVPGIRGVGVGLMAGWFPGVTATVGATIASAFGGERRPEEFIALASSISTVTSVFALVTLSVTGSGRSGVAMAAGEILGDSLGGFCSDAFLAVLLSMVVAAGIGYAATIAFGRGMSAVYGSIPGDVLGDAVLLLIAVLVFLMTGPFGLVVLTVGAGLGMIPPALGVGRASLASCLIVPSVLNCAGIPLGLPFI
jgi:putative membrane protein